MPRVLVRPVEHGQNHARQHQPHLQGKHQVCRDEAEPEQHEQRNGREEHRGCHLAAALPSVAAVTHQGDHRQRHVESHRERRELRVLVPFFRYFETKESAAFPDHADRVDALRRGLEARRPASAPLAAVIEVSRRSAAEFFEDPALYRPRYQLVRSVPSLRDHERVADRAYEDAIAAAIVAVVNHALDLWAFDEGADGISLLDDGFDMIAERFGPALDRVAPVGAEPPPGDLFVVIPGSDPLRARILELIADRAEARWQVDPGV